MAVFDNGDRRWHRPSEFPSSAAGGGRTGTNQSKNGGPVTLTIKPKSGEPRSPRSFPAIDLPGLDVLHRDMQDGFVNHGVSERLATGGVGILQASDVVEDSFFPLSRGSALTLIELSSLKRANDSSNSPEAGAALSFDVGHSRKPFSSFVPEPKIPGFVGRPETTNDEQKTRGAGDHVRYLQCHVPRHAWL